MPPMMNPSLSSLEVIAFAEIVSCFSCLYNRRLSSCGTLVHRAISHFTLYHAGKKNQGSSILLTFFAQVYWKRETKSNIYMQGWNMDMLWQQAMHLHAIRS